MRADRLKSAFWLITIGSWVLGFATQRWFGNSPVMIELSRAVRVNNPLAIDVWWKLIVYFSLSTVSIFTLSYIFFGVGGVVFLSARGMYDGLLIAYLENTIAGWTLVSIPIQEVLTVLIIVLILAVNLPLCIWASQLGMQRSYYTLNRLKGSPVRPEFGSEPFSRLLDIVSGALVVGLIAAVIFSYI